VRLLPWLEPRTAYLHIPFCGHHCGYCDFAVTAGQDYLIEQYLDALEQELRLLGTPRPVETLFLGGGTPTYLSAPQLERLLRAIHEWLPPENQHTWQEFTIESTPESITAEKVEVLSQGGVNRVSIGVQSFQKHLLQQLERQHGVEQIPHALELVRPRIPQVSLDLIFGAPGQTLQEWEADLQTALQLQPNHLSTYGLTYEKGTPLWKQRERGQVRALPEDDELAMYQSAIQQLQASGFDHYEISNFAKPGQESQHNQRYWANHAYHGFGVGAARYVDGSRELNVRDTKLYIRRILADGDATFQQEQLAPRDRAFETIATQLRRSCGIVRSNFLEQTGFELDNLIAEELPMLVENGLLIDNGMSLRLSQTGKCVADAVVEQLLKAS
jgi:oxygen-independent coproporphyrinogen III oxidase